MKRSSRETPPAPLLEAPPSMVRFGELVHRLRKAKGLTLEEVAQKIGSYKSYVSGIENGKVNPPSSKFIRRMAKLFGYDEREMLRLAYVEKAPKLIRDEIRTLMYPEADSESPFVNIPLLDTDMKLTVPRAGAGPTCAITVCDNSMASSEGVSFSRGDILLLSPVAKPEDGSVVYVVFTRGVRRTALLRRWTARGDSQVVLEPAARNYPTETVAAKDVHAVYGVAGKFEVFAKAALRK